MARKKKNSPKQNTKQNNKILFRNDGPKVYVVLYTIQTVDGPDSAFQGVYRAEGSAKAEVERTKKEFGFEDDEVWILPMPLK